MARVCQVTGKGPMVGNNVSHANNKTKRRFLPNVQYKRFWVESENRWIRLRVTPAAVRTITKMALMRFWRICALVTPCKSGHRANQNTTTRQRNTY